jgi:putative membrane protein
MTTIPILLWTIGTRILPTAVTVTTLLLALTSASLCWHVWGWQATVWRVGLIALATWAVEWLGASSDFPFGAYHYTPVLQPQLMGVPLLIPFAWLMLLPASWAVAARIAGKWHGLTFVLLSGLALTAWDLFLDPQMAHWNLWQWEQPGAYFGIPLQNYLGWWLTASIVTVLVRPAPLPFLPLLAIYGATWFFQSGGLIFIFGLPGAGLVGCLGMGSLLAWASYRHFTSAKNPVNT